MDITRRCEMCGEVKPIGEFYCDRGMPLGREYRCKPCARARGMARRQARRDANPVDPYARFWARVRPSIDGPNGCWEWTGARSWSGYGQLTVSGRRWPAHRYMWLLNTGNEPPAHLHVCHKCDNPGCVNPRHLFLGTILDNMADRDAKGRGVLPTPPQGDTHHNAKLTTEKARDIYLRAKAGEKQRALALEYGVDPSVISDVVRRVQWKTATEGL